MDGFTSPGSRRAGSAGVAADTVTAAERSPCADGGGGDKRRGRLAFFFGGERPAETRGWASGESREPRGTRARDVERTFEDPEIGGGPWAERLPGGGRPPEGTEGGAPEAPAALSRGVEGAEVLVYVREREEGIAMQNIR